MSRPFAVVCLALSLLVTGCAPMPPRETAVWIPPTGEVWTLTGRIAVKSGNDGWHAALNWAQTGEHFRIELSGPLGQGAVRLHGDGQGVNLERADGVRDWAEDAQVLLERHTGWNLPVAGLQYWVRGLAVPGQAAEWQREADGRPQRLRQDGWDIRYRDYQDQPGIGLMPRRIELERAGLSAKLLVDTWTRAADPG